MPNGHGLDGTILIFLDKPSLPSPGNSLKFAGAITFFNLQDDGSLERGAGAETFDAANEQVAELAKFWPGKYVVVNQETGEAPVHRRRRQQVH
jgi:hypothetical protein